MNEQIIINTILDYFKIEEPSEFREVLLAEHPYDIALAFYELSHEERHRLYTLLSPDELAPILAYLDPDTIINYFQEMNALYIAHILEAMAIDDAVDILYRIDERNRIAAYLSLMNKETAAQIRKLLQYEAKTAGSIMTTDFIKIPVDADVKQAMKILIRDANDAETIYILYVVDQNGALVGTLSLRELILARGNQMIAEIMTTNIISVTPEMMQEDVAQVFRNYDLNAIPVIDYQNTMLGIITVDDIVDVINDEASEDYERFAAVRDIEDTFDQNAWQNAWHRLPWLILLLILGLINSNVINLFSATIEKMVVLSFFLPLIAGMAGNTGTQTLAITIRKLAFQKPTFEEKVHHIFKEAATGLIIGLVTSIIAFGLIYLIQQEVLIAFLVGISILVSLVVATAFGALVPLIMTRLKIDPAVASGPFITTLNDLISMLIYLGLATWMLQLFFS